MAKVKGVYQHVIGKKYHWVISVDGDSEKVFMSDPENPHGFFGSTMEFTTEDGGVVEIKGPWNSNIQAFERDTSEVV